MNIKNNGIFSFLVVVTLILACAGLAAAQEMNQIKPPTMSKTPAKHRATRKAKPAMANTDADTSAGSTSAQDNPMDGGKDTDLSGTYMGTLEYPDGGMTGAATLTITGNTFTLAMDGGGNSVNGRISTVTTRGYIGTTLRFGDRTENDKVSSSPVLQISCRARKMGDHLSLMSVMEETHKFSFAPAKMSKKEKEMMCKPM